MVGWSISAVLDYFKILKDVQNNGLCLNLDAAGSLKMGSEGTSKEKKLRSLFDKILICFLKEIGMSKCMRPLPAVLGDGRSVDLYNLFLVVRTKGGCDSVSKTGAWNSVAEEIGLDSGVGSAVKLYYFKYLHPLDRWLHIVFKDDNKEGGQGGCLGLAERFGKLELVTPGLEKEMKSLLSRLEEPIQIGLEASNETRGDGTHCMNGVNSVTELGDAKKTCGGGDDNDVMILDPCKVDKNVYSRKRKRENLIEMLRWVLEIARYPCDEELGKFAEHRAKGGQDHLRLALQARNALVIGQHGDSGEENPLAQKKQKVQPTINEDKVSIDHSIDMSGCSRRLSENDSQLQHESSDKDTRVTTSQIGKENHQPFINSDSLPADVVANPFEDSEPQVPVRIGPLYQAEVPEWTGTTSESDSKWLGTLHWPLITGKQNLLTKKDFIGKGRNYSCNCRLRGSVECVRFHIAENKMRLKLELGSVFFFWRFHCMGEEVSLSWMEEEEKKFKSIVRLNPPSQDKCFWTQAFRFFRGKSKKTLVSYYFNVFVLRRRIYQNRVTPNNIDSDDDESEFGSVSNDFGHEAVKVPDSTPIVCSQNYQCIDLD